MVVTTLLVTEAVLTGLKKNNKGKLEVPKRDTVRSNEINNDMSSRDINKDNPTVPTQNPKEAQDHNVKKPPPSSASQAPPSKKGVALTTHSSSKVKEGKSFSQAFTNTGTPDIVPNTSAAENFKRELLEAALSSFARNIRSCNSQEETLLIKNMMNAIVKIFN